MKVQVDEDRQRKLFRWTPAFCLSSATTTFTALTDLRPVIGPSSDDVHCPRHLSEQPAAQSRRHNLPQLDEADRVGGV